MGQDGSSSQFPPESPPQKGVQEMPSGRAAVGVQTGRKRHRLVYHAEKPNTSK